MRRAALTFFSMLAFGILTVAVLIAILPWLSQRTAGTAFARAGGLQFESLLVGVALGVLLGSLGRYNWSEIPRRAVTWFLIRERQFFYYTLIGGCVGVLLFY